MWQKVEVNWLSLTGKERTVTERRRVDGRASLKGLANRAKKDYARHDGGTAVLDVVSDVPWSMLEDLMVKYYENNVQLAATRCKDIEIETRNQSGDETIYSIFYNGTNRSTTKVEKLVKVMLYNCFRGNAATKWGNDQEKNACQQYLEIMKKPPPQ